MGFAASAYATLLLCITYYLFNSKEATNPVDSWCIDNVSRAFHRNLRASSEKYSDALRDAVLAFSDLQVVTGISILISGYVQIRCGLAAYHWQLVVDQAWFSAITHLTTLTCLRSYFRTRPTPRLLRLIGMSVTTVMLAIALGSTGYWNNSTSELQLGYPAQCFFHPDRPLHDQGYNGTYVSLALGLLVFSYVIRVPQLFTGSSGTMRKFFRTRSSKLLKDFRSRASDRAVVAPEKSMKNFWAFMSKSIYFIYCLLKAAMDLYSSLLWEVGFMLFLLLLQSAELQSAEVQN